MGNVLHLPANRWRAGGLLLVPFILTLTSGHLTSVRAHGALIEGWCLEGCAAVRSGSRLCCEHHPIWPHVKPNRLTGSADHRPAHSCPAPTAPSPPASAPAKPTVTRQGPIWAGREELAATAHGPPCTLTPGALTVGLGLSRPQSGSHSSPSACRAGSKLGPGSKDTRLFISFQLPPSPRLWPCFLIEENRTCL